MATWLRMLRGDPLPWLLDEDTPAVRHLALRQLLDQPEDSPEALPCAWGAIKGLLALARIPARQRAPQEESAIVQGARSS